MKCNYAQGYYFAKPQVAQDIEQWLSQQTVAGHSLFCTHPENQNQSSFPSF
jgi:hypothetical protein